jgi:hypothetical protein
VQTIERKIISFVVSEGLALLTQLVEAGTSSSTQSSPIAALLPPIQYLALCANIIVHPKTTTRTNSTDYHDASNEALRYLRTVNQVVGPIGACWNNAFVFHITDRDRRTKDMYDHPSDEEADNTTLASEMATTWSLWANADNFWQVLGWAFNCSIRYPKRWERWKVFLELMVEVLEDDFNSRLQEVADALEHELSTVKDPQERQVRIQHYEEKALDDCLIVKYLRSVQAELRTGRRTVLQALLADGGSDAIARFGEIWKDECKEPPKESSGKKRKMNVDEDDFGDYDMEDEDEVYPFSQDQKSLRPSKRQQRRAPAKSSEPHTAIDLDDATKSGSEILGGIESVALRQRYLRLVRYIMCFVINGLLTGL